MLNVYHQLNMVYSIESDSRLFHAVSLQFEIGANSLFRRENYGELVIFCLKTFARCPVHAISLSLRWHMCYIRLNMKNCVAVTFDITVSAVITAREHNSTYKYLIRPAHLTPVNV